MRLRRHFDTTDSTGIDLAPMLDFTTNLLIFFIITTSFIKEAGTVVTKPTAETAFGRETGNLMIAIRDNGDIWMGYTQSSRWQVYNTDNSRPFRETNYEPEVLLVFRNNYSIGGWKGRMAAVGINHQSNGRGDPMSRSWNRIMFNVGLDREDWAVTFRPWIRIGDGSDDDNPGIEDYIESLN